MFQCLGLGTHESGGCGEDWYHPGCVVGLGPKWFEKSEKKPTNGKIHGVTTSGELATISEDAETAPNAPDAVEGGEEADDDPPPPPGFPADDDFETFICYKCVEAHPWIKKYAGTPGFLPPVYLQPDNAPDAAPVEQIQQPSQPGQGENVLKKRKADETESSEAQNAKRQKSEAGDSLGNQTPPPSTTTCKLDELPSAPEGHFSLFCKSSFRDHFCRCSSCFPLLKPHPQLLEEEEVYEPPLSNDGSENAASTHGSGSLLERGESALKNVDRVRAIEGVMAYNHLKEQLKPFFQQFAESGKAIGAEDIKEYFAKLRGDSQAIKDAGEAAKSDFREEQSGY